MTIIVIALFLCVLTVGQIYLLCRSTKSGNGNVEIQNKEEVQPAGDIAVAE